MNNVLIFLLGSVDVVDANATSGTPFDLIISTATMVVYALLADRWARRLGIARTATVPAASAGANGTHRLDLMLHG